MSITIKELVEDVNLPSANIQKVKWNTPIMSKKEGIYIVSLSENEEINKTMTEFPISMDILKKWINKLGHFTIDKEDTQDANTIRNRLNEFWIPDENIIYIGKAPLRKNGGGIGKRVQEYYDTAIGERGPHAGGHWIKLLECLNELHVFYIECTDSAGVESKLLAAFGEQVSTETKEKLSTKGVILPFANLEDGKKLRKKHGLGHMKPSK